MASWLHSIVEDYQELSESRKDPLVDSWFLMSSPIPVLAIIGFYLYFVLKLGPHLMKNRLPFQIKRLILVYNGYQVLFNVLLIHTFGTSQNVRIMYQVCHNTEFNKEDAQSVSTAAWWYFFSKIVDLFDTVFFVLRKKQSQVTFLHVYHHFVMVVLTWAFLKFLPSEQGLFLGFINTVVHAIMYFYYFMAALGPKYQKYLWWKKYMTRLQLIQFATGMTYLLYSILVDCKVPKALSYLFFFLGIIFVWLFTDFYRNAYGKRKCTIDKKNLNNQSSKLDTTTSNGYHTLKED